MEVNAKQPRNETHYPVLTLLADDGANLSTILACLGASFECLQKPITFWTSSADWICFEKNLFTFANDRRRQFQALQI